MWSKALRAVLFNIAAFSGAFGIVVFGSHLFGVVGLLLCLSLLALCYSGLRPDEANAPMRPWEWSIWIGGFAISSIAALSIAVSQNLSYVQSLSLFSICALTWAFSYLTVRDTYLAARGSKAPNGA
jgi:hypothetical protein